MLSAWLILMLHTLFFPLRLSAATGSFPRALKPEEERECLERAAAGDPKARDELIVHNLRLVAHIVKKYYTQSCEQDDLISIGITRVLTSGQEPDVSFGTQTVKEMIEYANGRIQILPGAGITARNMDRIIAETGCSQIHLAAHKDQSDTSVMNNRAIYYGGALYPPEDRFRVIDSDYIGGMVGRLADR